MTSYRYPSDAFPEPPTVTVDLPDGWTPLASAGSLMAFTDPASPESFRTNIVISATRTPRGTTLTEVVERALRTAQATLTGHRVLDEQHTTLAGSPAVVRTQQFQLGPGGATVFQVALMTMAPAMPFGVDHLTRIEGTCLPAAMDALQPVFRSVVGSLRYR